MKKKQLLNQLGKAIENFDIRYASENWDYLKTYIKYIKMLQRKISKLS